MRRWIAVAATALLASTAASPQQQPPGPVRLVAFTNEPREPELGEVFALSLQVRLAPGVVVFFPDTLLPAPDAVSAGPGVWELGLAPGDSVDVRATYPVIGLDPGGAELPSLELWARAAEAGERAGPKALSSLEGRAGAAPNAGTGDDASQAPAPGLARIVLPIGGALIMPFSAMTEAADAGLLPRPPADVLGREWSPWLLATAVVVAIAVGLLAWLFVAGRVSRAGTPVVLPPRAEALAELDRLRALGLHANGRVVEFYDATTGVLRHFADRSARDCGAYLTSTELLGRLQGRWGPERLTDLRSAVWSAERVKFGSERPGASTAEGDWATVRAWIAELPEGR
jgi:hypothetical protein